MGGSAVRSLAVDDPAQLADIVPGASFKAHAPFPGPFRVVVRTFGLGDIELQVGHSSPFAGLAAAARGRAILQVPFGKVETLVLNGVSLSQPMVGTYGPGAELQRANPQSNRHFTLTFPAELVESLLDPPSSAHLFRDGSARLSRALTHAYNRAVALVRAADRAGSKDPERFEQAHARRALRSALLHQTRQLIAPGHDGAVRLSRRTRGRMRVIQGAEDYIRANPGEPLYPEQVSAAVGISSTALHEAFMAHFAASPFAVLERRRLYLVRARLGGRDEPVTSIRALALAFGFWDFERFQRDYRATFGGRPPKLASKDPAAEPFALE